MAVDCVPFKGPNEIRRWATRVPSAPERNERLEIQLRQMPAQGWAALSVTAANWETLRREPIRLDWSKLEIDDRSEFDIFATLQPPRPSVPETLNEWLKKAERDSGRAPGVTTEMAAKLKALERENRELRQANDILPKASPYIALAELDRRHKP